MEGPKRDWVSAVFHELLLEDARRWVAEQTAKGEVIPWRNLPELFESAFETQDYVDALRAVAQSQ